MKEARSLAALVCFYLAIAMTLALVAHWFGDVDLGHSAFSQGLRTFGVFGLWRLLRE